MVTWVCRSTLARMAEFQAGPLAALRALVEGGSRVRVWTRGVQGVRGIATGPPGGVQVQVQVLVQVQVQVQAQVQVPHHPWPRVPGRLRQALEPRPH